MCLTSPFDFRCLLWATSEPRGDDCLSAGQRPEAQCKVWELHLVEPPLSSRGEQLTPGLVPSRRQQLPSSSIPARSPEVDERLDQPEPACFLLLRKEPEPPPDFQPEPEPIQQSPFSHTRKRRFEQVQWQPNPLPPLTLISCHTTGWSTCAQPTQHLLYSCCRGCHTSGKDDPSSP